MKRTHFSSNPLPRLARAGVLTLVAGLPIAGASLPLFGTPVRAAAAEGDEGFAAVSRSRVVPISLPAGAHRYTGQKELGKYTEALAKLAGEGRGPLGEVELLLWQDGAAARKALPGLLQGAGYTYAAREALKVEGGQITPFASALPNGKGDLVALWVEQNGAVVLAWAVSPKAGAATAPSTPAVRAGVSAAPAPAATGTGEPISIQLQPSTFYVNVMKAAMPPIPQFPPLAKKSGVVRGYVYDTQGRPLRGAKLGVRATAVGGFYSGASAVTDEKGYYEINAPAGVGHFYCAGYAVEHGEGLAAMSLHPADGAAGNFATPNGEVKNFVLLPYGIADRAKAQDDPRAGGNYYGGSVVLGWSVDDDRPIFSSPSNLPNGSTFEFTFTPTGPLVDGSRGRTIVIRKTVDASSSNQLYINNIPSGPYEISARMVGGGAMKMRETGPYGNSPFGLEPKQAVGKAVLMLRPSTADAGGVPAAYGSWGQISISLER